jgi:hypothetical protein
MTAILLKPDLTTQEIKPANGTSFQLEELQAMVEGWIEIVWLNDDKMLVINEEGKLHGMECNIPATALFVATHGDRDIIVGPALFCDQSMVQ